MFVFRPKYRRSVHLISPEQVWLTYDVSLRKVNDLLLKLDEDLKKITGNKTSVSGNKFRTVFLLDDFTGSGISYLRRDSEGFGGKIRKTLDLLQNGDMSQLVKMNDLNIYIIPNAFMNPNIANERKTGPTSEIGKWKARVNRFQGSKNQPPSRRVPPQLAELYNQYNITNTLFPLTYSCEGSAELTNTHTQHCEKCWWCEERYWAFGRYE